MKDVKVVFMGTPDFAVPVLKMLIEEVNVVMVVTQPDKEVGRKKEIRKSPVKLVAEENNIPVFQPVKIRNDYKEIEAIKPDLIITCAYGQIIPEGLLNIPKFGSVNVHASLLPKYRGSAPIQWCLINGEDKTGITLMYMDVGMDTGDIIKSQEYKIKESDNVGTLHDILSNMGASLLKENLSDIISGKSKREKQDEEMATYASMIKREDEHLDFNDLGQNIINKIRAFCPWPLANIIIDNEEMKIVEAGFIKNNNCVPGKVREVTKKCLGIDCKDGTIYLEKVKPFSKKNMTIESYLNGTDIDKLKSIQIK